MKNYNKDLFEMFVGVTAIVAMVSIPVGAWATHVIHCIQKEEWVFLIAGAIAAPIGIVHGIGIWFGAW